MDDQFNREDSLQNDSDKGIHPETELRSETDMNSNTDSDTNTAAEIPAAESAVENTAVEETEQAAAESTEPENVVHTEPEPVEPAHTESVHTEPEQTETASNGSQNSEPYHSSYDSYRFVSPDQNFDKNRQSEYNTNQYGERSDDTRFGSDGSDSHQNVNFSRPEGRRNSGGRSPKKPRKPKKEHSIGLSILLVAVFGAVAALVFFALTQTASTNRIEQNSTSSAAQSEQSDSGVTLGRQSDNSTESVIDADEADEVSSGSDLTIPEVTKKVMPSMVAITNTTVQQYRDYFGQTYDRESVSAGSGIIVGETDDHLLIATNNHVISGSSDITVTFVDDSAISGTVQGADSDNDLAIVSVNKSDVPDATMEAISIVEIGDSDSIQVGDQVVAIGNALGYGQSVSAGIISALNREVTSSDGSSRTVIQTDASINPGNSGGALLNMKGQLIGINEAKLVDTKIEGVGYAIPMKIAEPILTNLGNKASREQVSDDQASYLGITCVTMPSSYTENGYPEGVYVASVTSGGPADAAGIKEGDIITSFDGSTVTTKEELISTLSYYAAGETVNVSISRMNSEQNGFDKQQLEVTLGNKNSASSSESGSSSTSEDNSGEFDSRNGYFGGSDGLFGLFG